MLLFGILAYGIYFGAAHSVQQIAADAARTAIAGVNAEERKALTRQFIIGNAGNYSFVDVDKLDFEIEDSSVDANQFVVQISYDARDLPIWNIFSALPLPSTTISRTSTIRIGGI